MSLNQFETAKPDFQQIKYISLINKLVEMAWNELSQ